MRAVRVTCTLLLGLSSCQQSRVNKSPLAAVADSLLGGRTPSRCDEAVETFQPGQTPHQACHAFIGDTVVTLLRDADGALVIVSKHWKPSSAESLASDIASVEAVLRKRWGPGKEVCIDPGTVIGRRWQRPDYWVAALQIPERGELNVLFSVSPGTSLPNCSGSGASR